MVVLDTDVVVAGIRSRTGASAALITAALRGELAIALSVAMAIEYEAVVTRPAHVVASGLPMQAIMVVIDALIAVAKPIVPHFRWRPQLRDPGDEIVLETAVNSSASAIVTFNRRDFLPAAERFGIDILLPVQALERLK